jgi:hypothetical protein
MTVTGKAQKFEMRKMMEAQLKITEAEQGGSSIRAPA